VTSAGFETASKALVYAAVTLAVGTVGAGLVLRAGLPQRPWTQRPMWRRLDGVYLAAGALLGLALLARLLAHTVAAFGIADGLHPRVLRGVALQSRWGFGWCQQVGAAVLVMLAGLWRWRAPRPLSRLAAALAAVVACIALPRTGHAVSVPLGWALQGLHVMAAGLWSGTLLAVLAITRRPLGRLRTSLLRAFAGLAVSSVSVLVATGATAGRLYVGSLRHLASDEYGRVLLLKLGLVASMGLVGGVNWNRLHRGDGSPSIRAVWVEAGLALAVLVVTSWLTETAHP